MNLLARILSHGFAVAVVAFLIIGFMYRGELFPEWELPESLGLKKSQESTVAAVPADEETVAPDSPAVTAVTADTTTGAGTDRGEETEALPDTAQPAQADDVAPESALPQAPVAITDSQPRQAAETADGMQQSVDASRIEEPARTASGTPVRRDTSTVPGADSPGGAAAESGEGLTGPGGTDAGSMPRTGVPDRQGDTMTPMPGPGAVTAPATGGAAGDRWTPTMPAEPPLLQEPATAAADRQATTGRPETAAPATSYQLLAAARESFWLRDYSGAESQYRQLIEIEPENPDGYGELGNMYFSQGKWGEAASAYYEAGARLVTAGELSHANQLVEVIRGLNSERADELERLISAAETSP